MVRRKVSIASPSLAMPQPCPCTSATTPSTLGKSASAPPTSPTSTAWSRWCTGTARSEEHTSELQSLTNLVCRLMLEKKINVTSQLLELRNIATVPELIVKSALRRPESRDLNYNLDYPQTDPHWSQPTTVLLR